MTHIQTAYETYRREACEWCAKLRNRRQDHPHGPWIHVISVEVDPAGNTTTYEECAALPILEWADQRDKALRAENERLMGLLQFERHDWSSHRPTYAAMCLHEGVISFGKFCEWVRLASSGNDTPLPEDVLYSGGVDASVKELQSTIEAQARELNAAREGWSRAEQTALRQSEAQAREIGELREGLKKAAVQLAVARRYLPTHGSFGEEGIDRYESAQSTVRALLSSTGEPAVSGQSDSSVVGGELLEKKES